MTAKAGTPPEAVLIEAVIAWLKQQGRPVHVAPPRGLPAMYLQRGTFAAWMVAFFYARSEPEDEHDPADHWADATIHLLGDGTYQITTSLAPCEDDWICGLESHCSAWWHMAHECRGGRQCTHMPEPPSYLHSELGNVYAYPPKCWPLTLPITTTTPPLEA